MITYYGVQYYPTGIFNGTNWYVGGSSGTFNVYHSKFLQEMTENTPGILSLKVDYDPFSRTGNLVARLHSVDQIINPDLYLRYAITESHRRYQWQFLDTLNFILRDMLPNYNGVSFSINQGETFVDTQSFYMDLTWQDRNCELVVFVQSDFSKEVLISNLIPLYQSHLSGDANSDRVVSISDVVFLSNYIFHEGAEPNPSASGDPNEDGVIDIEDIAYLMNYLYQKGPAPLRGWEID